MSLNRKNLSAVPFEDRTLIKCMEILRQWGKAESFIKIIISAYVPPKIRAACTAQCKLEGLL